MLAQLLRLVRFPPGTVVLWRHVTAAHSITCCCASDQLRCCLPALLAVSGRDHQFVVVHNGIITNFRPLKNFLVRSLGGHYQATLLGEGLQELLQH